MTLSEILQHQADTCPRAPDCPDACVLRDLLGHGDPCLYRDDPRAVDEGEGWQVAEEEIGAAGEPDDDDLVEF